MHEPGLMQTALPPVLVIGVGNDLRGDDAAGWIVAEQVANWNHPGVRVLRVRQLLPEHSVEIAAAATVIVVDAAVGGSDTPTLQSVSGPASEALLSHSTSPSALLALGRLHDRTPAIWTIGIPAEAFEFGASPSPRCIAGIEAAVRLLAGILPVHPPPGAAFAFTGRNH